MNLVGLFLGAKVEQEMETETIQRTTKSSWFYALYTYQCPLQPLCLNDEHT